METKKYKLSEVSLNVTDGEHGTVKDDNNGNYFLLSCKNIKNGLINITSNERKINEESFYKIQKRIKLEKNDVLITTVGTIGEMAIIEDENINYCFQRSVGIIKPNKEFVNPYFLYYSLRNELGQIATLIKGAVQKCLFINDMKMIEVSLPDLKTQNKIVKALQNIDKKIKLNNEINNNLEEQLRLFFEEDILKKLNNENTYECSLYDQFDVIDNRGKTPPLVEHSKYPIIDVKVLSGTERVINYNNCLKYVSKETYDTFFRSGHPKLYDALLSTVGSLAELKIYLENIGTIAQNVVALRPKNDYPLFMYQYILSLKQRLTSYDIGSVQPSIKVTQFMKEIIKIPKDKDLIYKFENLANANTFKMKNLMMENRYLEQLRDTLLPKLMNGEIDLDNIEI